MGVVFCTSALALDDFVDLYHDSSQKAAAVGKVPRNFLSVTLARPRRPRSFDIQEVEAVVSLPSG